MARRGASHKPGVTAITPGLIKDRAEKQRFSARIAGKPAQNLNETALSKALVTPRTPEGKGRDIPSATDRARAVGNKAEPSAKRYSQGHGSKRGRGTRPRASTTRHARRATQTIAEEPETSRERSTSREQAVETLRKQLTQGAASKPSPAEQRTAPVGVQNFSHQGSENQSPSLVPSPISSTAVYHRYGYMNPRQVGLQQPSGLQTPNSGVSNSKQPRKVTLESKNKAYVHGLKNRNVSMRDETDTEWKTTIMKMKEEAPEEFIRMPTQDRECWDRDLKKICTDREAVLQRSIMMSSLARHSLPDEVDWTAETPWLSELPKHKVEVTYEQKTQFMPPPKPDLCVAFTEAKLEFDIKVEQTLGKLVACVFPEDLKAAERRGFHFFSMEMKTRNAENGMPRAHLQNFNTVTHALYNVWRLMEYVDMYESFYKNVRFISVAANGKEMGFRIHRAEVDEDYRKIDSEFPLTFKYDDLVEFGDPTTPMTYENVRRTMWAVLVGYGVKELLPTLNEALGRVRKKFLETHLPPSTAEMGQVERPEEESPTEGASQLEGEHESMTADVGNSFDSSSAFLKNKPSTKRGRRGKRQRIQ